MEAGAAAFWWQRSVVRGGWAEVSLCRRIAIIMPCNRHRLLLILLLILMLVYIYIYIYTSSCTNCVLDWEIATVRIIRTMDFEYNDCPMYIQCLYRNHIRRCHVFLADWYIYILAPSISSLQKIVNVFECELRILDLAINSKNQCVLELVLDGMLNVVQL